MVGIGSYGIQLGFIHTGPDAYGNHCCPCGLQQVGLGQGCRMIARHAVGEDDDEEGGVGAGAVGRQDAVFPDEL